MIEGFAKDVSLTDDPNYKNQFNDVKRKKNQRIALVTIIIIIVAAGIGSALYFLVFKNEAIKPTPIDPIDPVTLYKNSDIVKSLVDERQIEIIKLENGLIATLISDPTKLFAGASIGVNVGSLHDGEIPGLAHFAEHTLFLGSMKYPGTSTFRDHLSKYQGNSNAFTGFLDTVYFFNSLQSGFDVALDMFSRMFNETLLSIDNVQKEINAINSEFLKNKNNDVWRRQDLISAFFNDPFSTGNTETLSPIAPQVLLDKVKTFISNYYYATNMHLAMYSNETISALKAKAVKYFSTITNQTTLKKSNQKSNDYMMTNAADFHKYGLIEWMKSLRETYNLNIIFAVPFQSHGKDFLHFMHYLSTDESKGSFISEYKDRNFLLSMTVNQGKETGNAKTIGIQLSLTKEGMNHLEDIIKGLFTYINTIKHQPKNLEEIFKENNHIINQKFAFTTPSLLIENIAFTMNKMNNNNYTYLFHPAPSSQSVFNEELIKELFGYFDVKNSLILIETHLDLKDNSIKQSTVDPDGFFTNVKQSPYYGTEYNVVRLSDQFLEELQTGIDFERFSTRKVNLFISKETELITCKETESVCKEEREGLKANLLVKQENAYIYHRLDRSSKYPKSYALFNILIPGLRSPQPEVFNQTYIFSQYIANEVDQKLKTAIEAGNTINMQANLDGITITVYAFNDLFEGIIKTLFNVLKSSNIKLTEESFKQLCQISQKVKSSIENQSPYIKGAQITESMLKVNSRYEFAKITHSLQELNTIYADYPNHFIINGLFTGAISELTANAIVKDSISSFINKSGKIAKEFNVDSVQKVLDKLQSTYSPKGSFIYRARLSPTESNHAIVNHFYVCEVSVDYYVKVASIIHAIWGSYFFDVLRTKKQLGYVVQEELITVGNTKYFRFVIQGAVEDPKRMDAIMSNVIMDSKKKLDDLTDAQLNEIKTIMRQTAPVTFASKLNYYASYLNKRQLSVDTNDVINLITKSQVVGFFNLIFVKNVTKLSVQLYNSTTSIEMPIENEVYHLNTNITSIVGNDLDMLKKAVKPVEPK